jgi:hypothetical protein
VSIYGIMNLTVIKSLLKLSNGSLRLWQSYIVVSKTYFDINLLKEKERLQIVKDNLKIDFS